MLFFMSQSGSGPASLEPEFMNWPPATLRSRIARSEEEKGRGDGTLDLRPGQDFVGCRYGFGKHEFLDPHRESTHDANEAENASERRVFAARRHVARETCWMNVPTAAHGSASVSRLRECGRSTIERARLTQAASRTPLCARRVMQLHSSVQREHGGL